MARTKDAAIGYLARGWHPIALCSPDLSGQCGCGGIGHDGNNVGKAPISQVGRNYQDLAVTKALVDAWWSVYLAANAGILLEPSGLVVLDIDGSEGLAEVREMGLPPTCVVRTRKGRHLYYRRTDDFPVGRALHRGKSRQLDLLSKGYVVAPPSIHKTGTKYEWMATPEQIPIADVPPQLKALLERPDILQTQRNLRRKYRRFDRTENYSNPNDTKLEYLDLALSYLSSEDYEMWLHVGMALHAWDLYGNGAGQGFSTWLTWSRSASTFKNEKDLRSKWRSFRRSGITIGSLYAEAKLNGYSIETRYQGKFVRRRSKGAWKAALTRQ